MFAREAKRVIWRTTRQTVRELFMKNVRRGGQKSHLANSLGKSSRTAHEQCSPKLQKRSFGEQFGELFANSSANCSPKCTAVFGIENRKNTISSSHYGTAPYRTVYPKRFKYFLWQMIFGTVRSKHGTVPYGTGTTWFVCGITSVEEDYSEKTAQSDSLGE